MIKFFAYIFVAILVATCSFTSCANDDINEHKLTQHVYATPENFNGSVSNYFEPLENLYVEVGQSIKFYAGYSIDNNIVTDDTYQSYYSELNWNIDGVNYNLNTFRYTFETPGTKYCSLNAIDNFGDTLHNDFTVYVNTPNSVAIDFPYNGYNQVKENSRTQLPLGISVSGIDSWEEPTCQIFVAGSPDSVWQNMIGESDCNTYSTLSGVFQEKSTFYWAVKLLTKSASGKLYRDSTEIFNFTTKISGDSSILEIPLVLYRYMSKGIVNTTVQIISANGNILKTLQNDKPKNVFTLTVMPQSNLQIIFKENLKKEYAPETLTIDIPKSSIIKVDTTYLKDNIAPQIAPVAKTFDVNDKIQFYIYDDGSGINSKKLKVLQNTDTLQSEYLEPTLSFNATCESKCKLQIIGEDYARNMLPKNYWLIEKKSFDSIQKFDVSGPYTNEDLK